MNCFLYKAGAPLSVVLTGFLAITAQAGEPGMKIGLAVNDQFSSGEYNWSSDTRADHGLVPAIFVDFPLGRWRLAPTVSVVEKGGHAWYEVAVGTPAYTYRQYVGGSLLFVSCQSDVHFTFPLGNADFYFLAAPRVDVLINDGQSSSHPSGGVGAVPAYEAVTLGATLGLGQDISLGKDVLFLEFRYDRDLTPYWKAPGDDPYGTGTGGRSWYNRLFMFQIGVRVNASRTRERTDSSRLWPRD